MEITVKKLLDNEAGVARITRFGHVKIADVEDGINLARCSKQIENSLSIYRRGADALLVKYSAMARDNNGGEDMPVNTMSNFLTGPQLDNYQKELDKLQAIKVDIDIPVLSEDTTKKLMVKNEKEEKSNFNFSEIGQLMDMGILTVPKKAQTK